MKGTPFVVDESPYVCWDWMLADKNLEFLRGIDARYFQYVVESNIEHLEGEDKHRAALSIRLAYSHAIETLFALLGALVQAPRCPLGWMLAYRHELPEVVRKISKGELILARAGARRTWHTLSDDIHKLMVCDQETKAWIQHGFGDSWSRFATDFLNPPFVAEYNSMKHGLRVNLGGFTMLLGTPGVPAPDDAMKVVGGSIFGTSFFEREKIGNSAVNFRPRRRHRNWNPESILKAVVVASMSINNVTSYLRILAGDPPNECAFRAPDAPEFFREPWATSVGVIDMSMDTTIAESDITPKSKAEVLASYSPVPDAG